MCDPDVLGFEEFCLHTIKTVFPDIQTLRKRCAEQGYIPKKWRGELWCLLLTGSIIRDDDVFDHLHENINYSTIFSTSLKIVNSIVTLDSFPKDDLVQDMSDIIALYCKRMSRPYIPDSNSYLFDILVPLLMSSSPIPRPIASTCFYHLCTSFLPLAAYPLKDSNTLEMKKSLLITEKLTSWLRLLVNYHFPSLAIHLDSVCPRWEKLCAECGVASYGPATLSESTHPGSRRDMFLEDQKTKKASYGIIPPSWLGGLFCGTLLSPSSLLLLWDWALIWDVRYAGVYLTAALLGLHEDLLKSKTTYIEVSYLPIFRLPYC